MHVQSMTSVANVIFENHPKNLHLHWKSAYKSNFQGSPTIISYEFFSIHAGDIHELNFSPTNWIYSSIGTGLSGSLFYSTNNTIQYILTRCNGGRAAPAVLKSSIIFQWPLWERKCQQSKTSNMTHVLPMQDATLLCQLPPIIFSIAQDKWIDL